MGLNAKSMALLAVYTSILGGDIQFLIVFPFASYMVIELGGASDRSSTGFWVGLMAGAIVGARAMSATIYGCLSDHWGRKPVLLFGLVFGMVIPIAFGLSTSMPMALAIRFFQGLLSPISVVTKIILNDLCPGKEQNRAMAWVSIIWGFSYILGTVFGGLLCSPGIVKHGLFPEHPFVLPNLVPSAICAIALVLSILFLPETMKKYPSLLEFRKLPISRLLRKKKVVLVQCLSFVTVMVEAATSEVFTLWCFANIKDGGFSLDPSEIGIVLCISMSLLLPLQKIYYDSLCKKFSLLSVTKIHWVIRAVCLGLSPLMSYIRHSHWLAMVGLSFCYLALQMSGFPIMTTMMVFNNNSVKAHERGKINGIYMTNLNIARGAGTFLFGTAFNWSAKNQLPFPLNFAFSYESLGLILLGSYFLLNELSGSVQRDNIRKNLIYKY